MRIVDILMRDQAFRGELPAHYQGPRDRRWLLAMLVVPALVNFGKVYVHLDDESIEQWAARVAKTFDSAMAHAVGGEPLADVFDEADKQIAQNKAIWREMERTNKADWLQENQDLKDGESDV